MKLALLSLAAALALGQGSITGTIREIPDRKPLAGANITLLQNDVATASFFTGSTGEYVFRDLQPGTYTVKVAKSGYYWPGGIEPPFPAEGSLPAKIATTNLTRRVDFDLFAPVILTGRVEDEQGTPLADLEVGLGPAAGIAARVKTDDQGRFTSPPMIPGPYLAHITASVKQYVLASFTAEEATQVEYGYAPSYWPGGASEPTSALPVALAPGSSADLGKIRLKRSPFYRTRMVVQREDCKSEYFFAAVPRGSRPNTQMQELPCSGEYLLTGLTPGRYLVRMSNYADPDAVRWAFAEVEIGPDSRPIELRFQPSVTINGRLIPADGVTLPLGLRTQIQLAPYDTDLIAPDTAKTEEEHFTLGNLQAVPSHIQISLPAPFYVSEIRYGGQPVRGDSLTPVSGAEMELVVDNKVATITGAYSGGDGTLMQVILYRMVNGRRFFYNGVTPGSLKAGQFTIPNVAPGEYQIIAYRPLPRLMTDNSEFRRIMEAAPHITVKPAEAVTVSLTVQ